MSLDQDYYRCRFCNGFYEKSQLEIEFHGHKINGCPKCMKIDGLEPVSEGEYMQGIAEKNVQPEPREKQE